MDPQKEKGLIKQAQKDPAAFGPLFDEYYDRIFRYALHRTGNAEAARDIASETFYKTLKNLWRFRFSGAPFSAWLYRIAGNETVNYFRSNRKGSLSLDEDMIKNGMVPAPLRGDLREELEQVQEAAEKNEGFMRARALLAGLPQLYQEVLVLKYMEGKKIGEISRILGKKEGTVKSLISRGVAMMKKEAAGTQPLAGSPVLTSESRKKEQ